MTGAPPPAAGRGAPPELRSAIEAARRNPNLNLGRVVLLDELGRGGMGVVWRGWQEDLRRVVAVKVLPAASDPEANRRFLREARIAAKLSHPNIVPVHEIGEAGGRVYFTMELVEGSSLDSAMKHRRLDQRGVVERVRRVAEALDHAHRQGVVHRDIKPSNVLLDAAGTPFLTDFGLAQEAGAHTRLTVSGQLMGTPVYMSPEQARGQSGKADPRTDIYSLGAVLYEGLTGRPPVEPGDLHQILYAILHSDPARPSTRAAGIPRDLETICLKCLEKEPGKRYPTAGDLAADLGRFLEGEAIEARPPGAAERLVRSVKRRPGRAAVAAAAVLAVGLAVGWLAHSARVERERAALLAQILELKDQIAKAETPEARTAAAAKLNELERRAGLEPTEGPAPAKTGGIGDATTPGPEPPGPDKPPVEPVAPEVDPWKGFEAEILALATSLKFGEADVAAAGWGAAHPADGARAAALRREIRARADDWWKGVESSARERSGGGDHAGALALLEAPAACGIPSIAESAARLRREFEGARDRGAREALLPRLAALRSALVPLLRDWKQAEARKAIDALRQEAPALGPDCDALDAVAAESESLLAAAEKGASTKMKVTWSGQAATVEGAKDGKVTVRFDRGGEATTPLPTLDRADLLALAKAGGVAPGALGLALLVDGQPGAARLAWEGAANREALEAFAQVVQAELDRIEAERKAEAALRELAEAHRRKDLKKCREILQRAAGLRDTAAWKAKAADVARMESDLVDPEVAKLFGCRPGAAGEALAWKFDFSRAPDLPDWGAWTTATTKGFKRGYGLRREGDALWLRNGEARFAAPLEGDASIEADIELAGEEDSLVGIGLSGYGIAVRRPGQLLVITPSDGSLLTRTVPALKPGVPARAALHIERGRVRALWNGETVCDEILTEPPVAIEPGLFADEDCAALFRNVHITGTLRAGWAAERARTAAFAARYSPTPGAGKPFLKGGSTDGTRFGLFVRKEAGAWTREDDDSVTAKADAAPAELHAIAEDALFRNARVTFDYRSVTGTQVEIDFRQGSAANPRFYLPCDVPGKWRRVEVVLLETHVRALVDGEVRLLPHGPAHEAGRGGIRIRVGDGMAAFRNLRVEEAGKVPEEGSFAELLAGEAPKGLRWSEGFRLIAADDGGKALDGAGWMEFELPAVEGDWLVAFVPEAENPPPVKVEINGEEVYAGPIFKTGEPRGLSGRIRKGKAEGAIDRFPLFRDRAVAPGRTKIKVTFEGKVYLDGVLFRAAR